MTKGISGSVPQARDDLHARLSQSRGGGQPLQDTDISFMERRFGVDFSGVRAHTDSSAVQLNRELNAQAFTHGRDIYFGAGRYNPGISSGKRLLAHELTHVVQQGGGKRQRIQRHVLENDPSTALGMTCDVATSSPSGVSLDVTFNISSSTLSAADKAAVSNFVRNWHLAAVAEQVRVDGYASIDGTPRINWPLSCRRAETLANELMTPSDGSPGIPASSITLFAQGETDQFSSALAPNRRAQAHIPAVPISPPTITSQTVETSPSARTRTDIGVGEEVDLTHSAGNVTWATTAGTLSATTGSAIRLTAPDNRQTITVTAGGATKAFSVIAPTGVHMDRFPGTGIKHTLNRADSGIMTQPFLLPDTVNFHKVIYRELDVVGTATPHGAYSCNPFSGGHCSPPGLGPCANIPLTHTVVANKGTQVNGFDCIYSGYCGGAPPFRPGVLALSIPYEYKVGTGVFRRFATVAQLHTCVGSRLTSYKARAHGYTTVAAATSAIAQCP